MNCVKKIESLKSEGLSDKKPAEPCEKCSKQYRLNKNSKVIHNFKGRLRKGSRLLCPQKECNTRLLTYRLLREHLCEDHDINLYLEVVEFVSFEEFERWKECIEFQTLSRFTLTSAPKPLKNNAEKRYYECHRSYSFIPKGNGLRSLRMSGSSKTGRACPARMEATVSKSEKQRSVKVIFFKTHLGHDMEPDYISLNKETKVLIVEKLEEGCSFDEILRSVNEVDTTIKHLKNQLIPVTKKDIANVVRSLKSTDNFLQKINYNGQKKCNDMD